MLLTVFGVLLMTSDGVKANFSRIGYYPVVSCPKDANEWEASSKRLNCTNAHMYHCSPYKASQLYEFCYKQEVIHVTKGHCLALTEKGILNQDRCRFFSQGCPSDDYYSNESYKYQNCLRINGKCYTVDLYCNCLEAATKPTDTSFMNSNDTATKPEHTYTIRPNIDTAASSGNQNLYLPGFVVFVVISFLLIVLNVFLLRRLKCQNLRPGGRKIETPEEEILIENVTGARKTETAEESLDGNMTGDRKLETSEKGLLVENVTDDRKLETAEEGFLVENVTGGRKTETAEAQLYEMILTGCTIEDAELFRLLKQKCIIGSHIGFKYLVESRVKPNKKMDIFKQCDENGCLLLHFAAQGGSIVILDDIIEYGSTELLRYKCIRGQHALEFAIKFKQFDMTEHIIKKLSKENTQKAKTTGKGTGGDCKAVKGNLEKGAQNDYQHDLGEFAPVYWVAWMGNKQLLHILKTDGFDISTTTKTGLNALHISCISEQLKKDITFCVQILLNESKEIDPGSTDVSGWNVCHFASMSNFMVLEYIEKNENLRNLIMKKTKSDKTCLHIACEYAQRDTVKLIVKKFEQLIQCKDNQGWNALHFAAKGGNLDILEYLLKQNLDLGSLTTDHKTILHIACLGKNTDICRYAVKNFSKELLDVQTSEHKLTAVHYLGVQKKEPPDGSEEEILKIFCNSEMNLTALSCKGLTVLERAIDHLDTDVIRCMLKKEYREKFGITTSTLSQNLGPKAFINTEIRNILEMAIREMK